MVAAGVSHYWSIQGFITNHSPALPGLVIPLSKTPAPPAEPQPRKQATPAPVTLAGATPAPLAREAENPAQKEFFEGLLAEMRQLRNENRDLLDQISETNREVMKLEFRVDTHSESFRPLPTSEQRFDTTFGSDPNDIPGVLPPRAAPVYPLED
jgi:hypothetical protein